VWKAAAVSALAAALVASGLTAGVVWRLAGARGGTASAAEGTLTTRQPAPGAGGLGSGKNTPEVPAAGGVAPAWDVVAAAVRPTVVAVLVGEERMTGAEGSGVVVNAEEGHVVTNNHVVADGGGIKVVLADGRMFAAEVLGADPGTDLAVLKLRDRPPDLSEAVLGDSDLVVVGEPVMAVGNPLGLDNTATTGIVSALNRPVEASESRDASGAVAVTNAIQLDAAINPGNSGGPLFNAAGEVVGVNTSIATLGGSTGRSGSIGLAFAIPSNQVADVAAQLVKNGAAAHPYLGATTADTVTEADGATRAGAGVRQVAPGSPADAAGLVPGDVVVGIDGHPVTGSTSLTAWVRSYPPGAKAVLAVVRGDAKTHQVEATLTVRDDP
jgi:putative serine protease PepD